MISTRGLSRNFGSFEAVRGLDLDALPGQVYGFLGPNGAGKTTTIRMLTGLLKPGAGSIQLAGVDLLAHPLQAKALTGYVPDRPELFPALSGRETLALVTGLYSLDPKAAQARAESLLEAFGLTAWGDEDVEGYSHGMKQKLALACALLPNPRVLILDEPMVGLDPQGGRQVKDLLRRLASRGMTVFLSIHTLEIAEQLCDRLGILMHGSLLAQGSPAEVLALAGKGGTNLEEAFLALTGGGQALSDTQLFGQDHGA